MEPEPEPELEPMAEVKESAMEEEAVQEWGAFGDAPTPEPDPEPEPEQEPAAAEENLFGAFESTPPPPDVSEPADAVDDGVRRL
jgi:hypothetical protein